MNTSAAWQFYLIDVVNNLLVLTCTVETEMSVRRGLHFISFRTGRIMGLVANTV